MGLYSYIVYNFVYFIQYGTFDLHLDYSQEPYMIKTFRYLQISFVKQKYLPIIFINQNTHIITQTYKLESMDSRKFSSTIY